MTSPADLGAIRARLAALDIPRLAWNHGQHNAARADLIAHAPADLAALCDEVEALTARAERAEAAVQRVREVSADHWDWKAGRTLHTAILSALAGDE